jgi:hypothetical protein
MIDLVRDQLSFQAVGADAAETKPAIYFAVGSTLQGVLVAVVALNPPAPPWAFGCASAVVASYVVLTVLCLAVYRAEKWQIGLDVRNLAARRGTRSASGNQAAVLQTLLRDSNHNLTPYPQDDPDPLQRYLSGRRLCLSDLCRWWLRGFFRLPDQHDRGMGLRAEEEVGLLIGPASLSAAGAPSAGVRSPLVGRRFLAHGHGFWRAEPITPPWSLLSLHEVASRRGL